MARKRISKSAKPQSKTRVLREGPRNRSEEREIRSESATVSRKTNDPQWYSTNAQLLQDAADITFSNASGVRYSLNGRFFFEPGIQVIDIIPSISDVGTPNSPINIAAYNFYSYVRHANSGSVNYDSPDLMLYAIAIAQIYSYINYCMRVYGVANLYSHANRYMPKALVTAMNWDFDDLIKSMANFRYGLNVLIHKAASLACPADMPYFRRLAFLFSGLYAEGESVKSQLYFYNPVGFMQYDDAYSETGGGMKLLKLPTLMTTDQMIDYGNKLLDPIISSESMNIMSGDILKAYGSNILKLMPLESNYMILPITDLNVLEQMSNVDFLGWYGGAQEPTVTIGQVVGTTNQRPHLAPVIRVNENFNLQLVTSSHLINTILTNPTAGDVIERTRGMVTMKKLWDYPVAPPSDQSMYNNWQVYTGSDFATGVRLYYYDEDYNLQNEQLKMAATPIFYPQSISTLISDSENHAAISSDYAQLTSEVYQHCVAESFKFHPKMFYLYRSADGTQNQLSGAFAMDLDNYATIDNNKVSMLNEEALLSLFNVESIGRF